jgi:hypothetical protein
MRYLLLILFCSALCGETLDRIAITIGKQVITESQVLDEIRVTAFIDGEKPDFGGASKRKAAERLVERALIERELTLTRYALPEVADIGTLLVQVKARYANEAEFQKALVEAGVAADQVEKHLQLQVRLLRFLDYRFRPGVRVEEEEIAELYEKQSAEWKTKHKESPPTLEASRADLVALLTRERADRALDRWLGEARTREQIVYREGVFK